jgi:hypothetical protein
MEDMPLIFEKVEFSTTVLPGYDVYLMDSLSEPLPKGLIIHMKSKLFCLTLDLDTPNSDE